MDIFEIICLWFLITKSVVNDTAFVIRNKDKITKFFKNLFTKGKKKKLTEPEPVTEAPISSTPPHKRKRMRPPKPKRPKIELHPLRFVGKVFGWISAKAKLVAQKSGKLFVGLLKMIGKALWWLIRALLWFFKAIWGTLKCTFSFIGSILDKIDVDKAFAVCGAVLMAVTYVFVWILSVALDG